jgi:hypothetical protein
VCYNQQADGTDVCVHRGFLTNLNSVIHAVVEQLTKWTNEAGKENIEVHLYNIHQYDSIIVVVGIIHAAAHVSVDSV